MASSIFCPAVRTEQLVTTPFIDSTAISDVPPPISTTIEPDASSTGSPAPMAAATGSSTRCTERAPALRTTCCTAWRSTGVMPQGTHTTTRGRTMGTLKSFALWIRYLIITCVESRSAITPSVTGRMAVMLAGVRPIIFLASSPTASTCRRASERTATIVGSRSTMPLPST